MPDELERMRALAASQDLTLQIETVHDDDEAADLDVLRQLDALGARLDRPLLVEVDLVPAGPRSTPDLLTGLQEQGFCATVRGDRVQVDVLTFGTLRTVRSLRALLDRIAQEHAGHEAGWRARPPLAPADLDAAVREGERSWWTAGDLLGARDALVPVLAGDDPVACPTAAARLFGLLVLLGDARGAELLSGWMGRGGADAWGAQGATVYAIELRELHTEVDRDVLALLRPALERAVETEPEGWGALAMVELAEVLVLVGDVPAARPLLERAVRSGRRTVEQRGHEILALLDR